MSHRIPAEHPLRRLFTTAVHEAFREQRDLYSPDVASHLTDELLPDFVHVDRIYRLRTLRGRRLDELPDMIEVGHEKEGPERSLEVNRYIGDFVLFMCGFFPTLVRREAWFAPRPMVSRVGGILVQFKEPLDYYIAEGRNAYARAARTAALFAPEIHHTYERLGEKIEGYQALLGRAKEYLESRPEAPDVDGLIA